MRPVWIELPAEDYTEEDQEADNVGLLEMSLYGTRDAAQNWQNTVETHLRDLGFKQELASGSVFYHEAKGLSTLVHGDDYVTVGAEENANWLKMKLEDKYEIKTTVVGRRPGLKKEVRILNRVVMVVVGGDGNGAG